jgi:hypothetical protein
VDSDTAFFGNKVGASVFLRKDCTCDRAYNSGNADNAVSSCAFYGADTASVDIHIIGVYRDILPPESLKGGGERIWEKD